jgi:outer membrane protein assembly factor BamB
MCQGVALVSEVPSSDIHKGVDLVTTDVIWNMLAGNAIRADYLDPESCLLYGHHLSEGHDTYVALDSRSGQNVWSADVAASSKLITIDEKIVIIEVNGEYLVLDRTNGSLIKTIVPNGQVEKAFFANGVLLLSYSELGITSAIDVTTGETAWENQDLAAKEMVETGEVLVFRLEDDTLVGVSESSGEVLWSGVPIDRDSALVVHDTKLYFRHPDASGELNGIVSLDPATGSIVVQTESLKGEVVSMLPLSQDSWLVEIIGNANDKPGTLILNKLVQP